MAATSGRNTSTKKQNTGRGTRQSASGKKTGSARSASGRGTGTRSNSARSVRQAPPRERTPEESALFHEIGLIVLFAAMVLLFLCNFGIIGDAGKTVSGILFGVFGLTAYVAPVLVFLAVAFHTANKGNPSAMRKLLSGVALFLLAGILCDMLAADASGLEAYSVKDIYEACRDGRSGGGVLAGSLTYLLQHNLGTVGTVLIVLLCAAISLILLTEKSLLGALKSGGERMRERAAENADYRDEEPEDEEFGEEPARRRSERAGREQRRLEREEEQRQRRREERERKEEDARRRAEERRLKAEEKENNRILKLEPRIEDPALLEMPISTATGATRRDDIHEIIYREDGDACAEPETGDIPPQVLAEAERSAARMDFDRIQIRTSHQVSLHEVMPEEEQESQQEPEKEPFEPPVEFDPRTHGKPSEAFQRPVTDYSASGQSIRIHKEEPVKPAAGAADRPAVLAQPNPKAPRKYIFPPVSKLKKGKPISGDTTHELEETAFRLQETLRTFGVNVTITDVSQGPSVTRYELQPEQGVKVSKIVGLSDDIKMHLAATDIRIEAPIPGKAAVGIEVPNRENMTVAFRDLVESKEFREFPSNLAFAVGKDIAGKVVVTDIAKMPHVLIAGATGSGKSVCINTIIMSILYKAHPDDVKLIMVDPKVVELSVYNGIPHLLIPVVTDSKKASAALHWGVTEMEDRYRKFADFNVRDLKGYNAAVAKMQERGEENVPAKMPQIVIIVDELADLMMVCAGEVEESICRLAQLARAAGIHLVVATQRPSVDVITGLIKTNMPSRIAFSVASGVDSRTILDMNGAEKLLGKGDMLFYPQGYTKPARIQGAFISDDEVFDVVDFIKNQKIDNDYAEEIEQQIQSIGSSGGSGGASGENSGGGGSDLDEYFADAGRLIIEKEDKASIGMLQRAFKIGFNRAARITDQLCEYGVVGEGEGTKPRKVLMTMEQFERLLEEIG